MEQTDSREPALSAELRELLRLAGAAVAHDELADALLRLAQGRPEVAQAYCLGWQPAAGTCAGSPAPGGRPATPRCSPRCSRPAS